jgi:hypothetical protein
MVTVIISHECKNYSDWRKVFDADEVNRSKAGFKSTGVYHSVDNANKITIIGEAPSVEAINGFMANPELKVAMEKGGVIGMPDVKILSKIWFRSLCLKVGLIQQDELNCRTILLGGSANLKLIARN